MSVIGWICFLFSFFLGTVVLLLGMCLNLSLKLSSFFLTASAAKEAMLPYFPQIVVYLKVTQDIFFTVYCKVPPIAVFQTSPVGVFFNKDFLLSQ